MAESLETLQFVNVAHYFMVTTFNLSMLKGYSEFQVVQGKKYPHLELFHLLSWLG